MHLFPFQLVNVFAESHFGGNPLAVFTDAEGLDDAAMQAIARQFNLSETVFLFPSSKAAARLRIFTPSYEMPFAGHPTLGSAAVLHRLGRAGDDFVLQTEAGPIPLTQRDGVFTLQANAATARPSGLGLADTAAMLGLAEADIVAAPEWLDTGTEQLLVRIASREAVLAARPDPQLFMQRATLQPGRSVAYLWHEGDNVATVRLFFEQHGAVIEDPGTGSACANLGGWCALNGRHPLAWRIEQGHAIDRLNVLQLSVDAAGRVRVGGRVIFVASGVFELPDS
ncbi:PhzF family phenazine biosynthesis protein [Pseudogulbenkiania ferrooxidans]|uniref:Phenazine biosynthesis protein PhzF family n=1 Tax=Pseudogulbenkiania ferrooxidans 2002 TaxID=279714 RepID=B9Z256_9NEIS|nr:PhzF family phenazine biosynthesis protein [Pseudogulbenkiania ferrooxidans]EEG09501.1 phenazine biosynthesis protein PhzF family [Pseudogulbenkiania ferrooxidans 2002]